MGRLGKQLREGAWGLARARAIADGICEMGRIAEVRALISELFGEDVEVRKRAADVARRVSEREPTLLAKYADELSGLLAQLPVEEARTRWHLGLVVPRIALTQAQRLRAARAMLVLAEDASNVVRCSAVEGLGTLALAEPSLREEAEAMVEQYLCEGTLAMKSRSRHVRKLLAKRYGER
jgi:hypothetical protein